MVVVVAHHFECKCKMVEIVSFARFTTVRNSCRGWPLSVHGLQGEGKEDERCRLGERKQNCKRQPPMWALMWVMAAPACEPLPCQWPRKSNGRQLVFLSPSYPYGRPGWRFRLLASSHWSPGGCGYMGSDPENEKPSLFLPSLSW